MKIIFYLSLILIFYTYAGYPLMLFLFSLFIKKEVKRGNVLPDVTVIIPVYNEEGLIGKKIENCLSFDYPENKLKIIVVSDASTDNTENIVKKYDPGRIRFLSLTKRQGKVAAQNYAVRHAHSEIIVFTDVAINTDRDCVKIIVENFIDNTIGAVSCRDYVIKGHDKSEGESAYINYDMLVRKCTSQIGSIIGVTGGFYAVRSFIAEGGWNPAFPPDFYVALRTIKKGLRVVEDERVKAYYKTAAKGWDELQRKVRTINRGMHAFFYNISLLNFFKYGLVSFELISHKLLRWLTPFLFILLLVSNMYVLNESAIAIPVLCVQVIVYVFALISFYLKIDSLNKMSLFRLPKFFVIANLAILKAWYELIVGEKYVLWQPTKR